MGKRYLPVVLRSRSFKMFEEDFTTIKCIKKRSYPRLPRFEEDQNHSIIDNASVFVKEIDEESVQTDQGLN